MSRSTILLGALVASAGLNAFLLVRAPRAAGETSRATAPVAAAPSDPGRAEAPRPSASHPTAAAPAPRRAAPGRRTAPAGDSPGVEPQLTGNDLELEEDVRDFLGRECLRKELLSEREQNDKFLRSFTDPAERERWTRKWIDRYTEQLSLNETEAARFEKDYREIVKPLWDSAAASIHGDEIDYAALVDDLRTLNDREDQLFAALRGPDGVAKIRAQLVEKRTRLIAMLEAYADASR